MFLVGFMATKSLSPDLGHFYGSLPPLVMYAVAFVKAAVRGVMVAALFVPGVFVRGLSRRPSPTPPPSPPPSPFTRRGPSPNCILSSPAGRLLESPFRAAGGWVLHRQ